MVTRNKMEAEYFRKYQFTPATVIDVGVLDGTPFLYESFPDAKFVLVDPLEESEMRVGKFWGGKIDYDFHVCCASDAVGDVELKIPRGRPAMATSGGGRMDGNAELFEARKVPARRLDDIVGGYSAPFGLKIDTEGHELSVLQGATETLRNCEFVIAETSIKRRFPGGYRFSELIGFMADHGFEAHAFLSGFTRSPRMADVLFVPWDSPRFDMTKRRKGRG